jgi:hypothetical protein
MKASAVAIVGAAILVALASPLAAQEASAEHAAIKAAALDYIEGYFSGDAARMARALHPELTKVTVTAPQQGMNAFVRKMTATELIEITRSKRGAIPKEQWGVEVTVLDVYGSMAAVKIVNPKFFDYLQLAKIDGAWKIVNVLWGFPAAAPKP